MFANEELFWEHVPRPFMERLLRCIFDAYQQTEDHCQQFETPERTNLRPLYRREVIEGNLRAVATKFSGRVTSDAVKHRGQGFWFHTRIICGEKVALTQNTVSNPESVVRKSLFRDCYARRHNQPFLFPAMEPEQLPSESLMYGIIVHGRSTQTPMFPGFAQVRFPKPRLEGYYRIRIDLFNEFPEVVEEKTTGLPTTRVDEPEIEPELLEEFDDVEYGDDLEALG